MAKRRNPSLGDIEGLVVLAGVGALVYWLWNGGWSSLLQGASSLNNALFPHTTSPAIPVGSGISGTGPGGSVSWIPQGDFVAQTSNGPMTIGPNGIVPGTGWTLTDLRTSGYSDDQIGQIVQSWVDLGSPTVDTGSNPFGGGGAPASGASSSW
jgi:hypothetical protein